MNFDIVDLRLFVNTAEGNNLTLGAARSHMSVPAASVRIKNIEQAIGAKLFYRTSHGVTLTPSGGAFLHHARLLLRQFATLEGDLREYATGLKGQLRMAANATAISEFLPGVLRAYLKGHPDVNIHLQEGVSPEILRDIQDGTIDIGIVAADREIDELTFVPYRKDRWLLVTARDHPLAAREQVTVPEILDYPLVSLPEGSGLHAMLFRVADAHQLPVKLRIQVGNFETICRMVETDIGVALVPGAAARRHARTMAIACVAVREDALERNLQIAYRTRQPLPAFARELIDALLADADAT